MRRRVVRICAALSCAALVAVGAAGCVKGKPTDPKASPSRQDTFKVQQQVAKDMQHRRAKALLDGDEKAWLADIDPAEQKTVDDERMRFTNLRQLGLTSFELISESVGLNGPPPRNPSPGTPRPKYEGFAKAVLQFSADVALTTASYLYRYTWDGKKFTIVEALPVRNFGEMTKYAKAMSGSESVMLDSPWDYLPLKFAKAGPVTIAAPKESPWNPADFVAPAQQANDLVRGVWGGVPASRGFLVFLADTKQAQEWFGQKADMSHNLGYTDFAAIATQDGNIKFIKPELGQPPKESRAGARIVINMEQVKKPDAAYNVLAHEMTHAIGLHLMPRGLYIPDAAHKGSTLDTPFWVIEGFAAWVDSLTTPDGVQQTLNSVRSGWSKYHQSGDPGFPTNDAFFVEPAVDFNYAIGASFFAAVDRVAGRAKVVTAYVALIQQSTLVANDRTLMDPVLANLGIDAKKVWTTWHSMVGH